MRRLLAAAGLLLLPLQACQSDTLETSGRPGGLEHDVAGSTTGGSADAHGGASGELPLPYRPAPDPGHAGSDEGDEGPVFVGPDNAGGSDASPDAGPEGGACLGDGRGVGCPCDAHEQCASDYCVATDAGMVCVDTCVDSCPAGHACLPIQIPPDVVFLCLPRFAKLCQPCVEHAECQARGDQGVALCVDYGDAGSFCGAPCKGEGECPDGFACEERRFPDGSVRSQCIKLEGECACNSVGSTIGMVTECKRSNEHGSCVGRRSCGPAWLGECDATEPSAEVCDGEDNDCDGDVDNLPAVAPCYIESPYGVCEGKPSCADGEPICVGRTPQPEICNGVDDDCDGSVDEATCDDGVACTVDACDASAEACVFQAIDEACDDGNPCTVDACDPGAGCVNTELADTTCDDGNPCTVADACVEGSCRGTAIPACCATDPDCDDFNPCTKDTCLVDTGTCEHDADSLHGAACDADGDGCTLGDVCLGGSCKVGTPVECGPSPFECRAPVCVSEGAHQHRCDLEPRIASHACSDGDVCTVSDTCDGEGNCRPGEAVPGCCREDSECDDQNACTVDLCEAASGQCRHLPAADGKPCDADGSGCTAGDECLGGSCKPGPAVQCASAGPCSHGECVSLAPNEHQCVQRHAPGGTSCTDHDPCTRGDACDGNGSCEPGAPDASCCRGQGDCEDFNPCTADACDLETGDCRYSHLPGGSPCDADGDGCTRGDACDAGVCVPGPVMDCSGQGAGCIEGSCESVDATHARCVGVALPKGTPCDDGQPCTADGSCNDDGACEQGPPRDCAAETVDTCKTAFCDPLEGCVEVPLPDGDVCDDGDGCTVFDLCVNGSCMPGSFVCGPSQVQDHEHAGYAPELGALPGGRLLVRWTNTPSYAHGGLRWMAADGSLESQELSLSMNSDSESWSSAVAVDGLGNALFGWRSLRDLALRVYSRDGEKLHARSDEDIMSMGVPNSYDHIGRIVPLRFADGSWGVVGLLTYNNEMARPFYLHLAEDLSGDSPEDLPAMAWYADSLDAAVAGDGSQRFWLLLSSHQLDTSMSTGKLRLWLRLYNANGQAAAAAIELDQLGDLRGRVASLPSGAAAVAWHACAAGEEEAPKTCRRTLHARVLAPDGAVVSMEEAIFDDDDERRNPEVAALEGSAFAVAYQHRSASTPGWDVRVAIFEPTDGSYSVVSDFAVPEEPAGDQTLPNLVLQDDGLLAVAWREADNRVWLRRMGLDGRRAPMRPERPLNASFEGNQQGGAAARGPDGKVMAAYASPGTAGENALFYVTLDPDGALLRREARVAGAPAGEENDVSVGAGSTGFLAAWEEVGGGNRKVKARRFDPEGEALGEDVLVDTWNDDTRRRPAVAVMPDGAHAITWQKRPYNNTRIMLATFHANGESLGEQDQSAREGAVDLPFVVADPAHNAYVVFWRTTADRVINAITHSHPGGQWGDPRIVAEGKAVWDYHASVSRAGMLLLCWVRDGVDWVVRCGLYDPATLSPVGSAFPLVEGDQFDQQRYARTAWLPDGGFLVAWSQDDSELSYPTGDLGVFVQAFGPDAAPRGSARLANLHYDGEQKTRFVLPVSTSRVWVGWDGPEPEGDGNGVRYRVLGRF